MAMQKIFKLFVVIIFFTITGLYPTVFSQTLQDNINIFQISYSQRMRVEMWDNTIGLSKSAATGSSYIRNRSSLGCIYSPSVDLTLSLKLTNELRYYTVPETRGFEFDEVFIDQLYLRWNNPLHLPFLLTLGRQNIMFGEGFVVMDGGPLDGSRSAYFNAARLDWTVSGTSKLTFFFFYQPEWDQYLPTLNRLKKKLIEHHEEGFGINYTRSFATGEAQGYLIRKSLRSSTGTQSARIITPGARLSYTALSPLIIVAEGAYELGDWNTYSMGAYGGYLYGEYSFEKKWYLPNKFTLGGIYLSGDDYETENYEGWDPLFSRWPKWSESYIYAQVPEQGPAYWSNIISAFAKISYELTSKVIFTFDYHHLMAPENARAGTAFPGGIGKTRGELFIGKISYTLNDYLTGHVLVEHFMPGNYYFDGADSYTWIRFETFLNF
jgi:hypothetical protein